MKYYKVRPTYDGAQVLKTTRNGKLRIDRNLVANELYTPAELRRLMIGATLRGCGIKDDTTVFDTIEISNRKTYWFFGARFSE